MALAQPADRGIARHAPDLADGVRDQRDARAQTRAGQRGLQPRVAATDDDHVVAAVRRGPAPAAVVDALVHDPPIFPRRNGGRRRRASAR